MQIINENMEQDNPLIFKFTNFGSEFIINIEEDNEAQCPMCKRRFRQLLQHFRQIKVCGTKVDLENFKREYQLFVRAALCRRCTAAG